MTYLTSMLVGQRKSMLSLAFSTSALLNFLVTGSVCAFLVAASVQAQTPAVQLDETDLASATASALPVEIIDSFISDLEHIDPALVEPARRDKRSRAPALTKLLVAFDRACRWYIDNRNHKELRELGRQQIRQLAEIYVAMREMEQELGARIRDLTERVGEQRTLILALTGKVDRMSDTIQAQLAAQRRRTAKGPLPARPPTEQAAKALGDLFQPYLSSFRLPGDSMSDEERTRLWKRMPSH